MSDDATASFRHAPTAHRTNVLSYVILLFSWFFFFAFTPVSRYAGRIPSRPFPHPDALVFSFAFLLFFHLPPSLFLLLFFLSSRLLIPKRVPRPAGPQAQFATAFLTSLSPFSFCNLDSSASRFLVDEFSSRRRGAIVFRFFFLRTSFRFLPFPFDIFFPYRNFRPLTW